MRPSENAGGGSELLQLVSFRVGDEEYGLGIHSIREIIRYVEPTVMPGMPEIVEGMIDLRGSIVPVVDLRKTFGLVPRKADPDTRVVVVEHGSGIIGFRVDQVSEVIRIDSTQLDPPPTLLTGSKPAYVISVAKLSNRLLMLLDTEVLLSSTLVGEPQFAEQVSF